MGVTCNKSGSALESRAARRRPRKGGHNTQNRNDTYPGWQGKSNGGGGVSPALSSADAEKTLERAKCFQGEGLASLDAALE